MAARVRRHGGTGGWRKGATSTGPGWALQEQVGRMARWAEALVMAVSEDYVFTSRTRIS
jgi:hypothetical protein